MSDVQDRFAPRGVRVIALSGPDTAETTLEGVRTLLAKRPERFRMSVAYDVDGGSTSVDVLNGRTAGEFLGGAGLDGIPITFVIDREGRIAWVGQPAEVSAVLDRVVAGTWDVTAARERQRLARAAEATIEKLREDLTAGRLPDAMVEARQLVEGTYAQEAGHLRLIASLLANSSRKTADGVDLDLALKAATKAADLSENADPTVLVTLALVHSLRCDLSLAIRAEQAIGLSVDERNEPRGVDEGRVGRACGPAARAGIFRQLQLGYGKSLTA